MALHPRVLSELLDAEVEQARAALGARAGDLRHEDGVILMTLTRPDGSWNLRLDARDFDAEPYDLSVVDTAGHTLPLEAWPPGLAHSVHPVFGTAWACISGTRAYYSYPGHHADRWDTGRYSLRADTLLRHVLQKVGL